MASTVNRPSFTVTETVALLNWLIEVGTKSTMAGTPSTLIECLLSKKVPSPTETVTSYFHLLPELPKYLQEHPLVGYA